MGYRIAINMAAAPGAEARLWALISQRRIDVTTAWFRKNRLKNSIEASLEVELDLVGVRRLMRQLGRHHDIHDIALDSSHTVGLSLGQGPVRMRPRRLRISAKKGACL
ncbi:MAG: amino acid-binding protein [Thermaerobacter sp.]|nr:amino acid-binding protein [Thermaerobacter sp.]